MKNFSELLATNFSINIDMLVVPRNIGNVEIWINSRQIYNHPMQKATQISYQIPILQPVEIRVLHSGAYVESCCFDGWESRPAHGEELPGCWQFVIGVPFYQWKHHATAQGWLLEPN